MPYLTYEEYLELGFSTIEDTEFNRLIKKASDILDNATNHFYKFNSIENDVLFRREQFKKALGAQIEYFNELGATTFESINNAPQTFSIGRMSVSNASRYNPSGANESKSLVAEDVYIYLEGTGLLYAGVASW